MKTMGRKATSQGQSRGTDQTLTWVRSSNGAGLVNHVCGLTII